MLLMLLCYVPIHNKGKTINVWKIHMIRNKKNQPIVAKIFHYCRIFHISSYVLAFFFRFAARLRHLWGKFIILYRSVAIASRIFSLAASQSPIWLPHRTNCTSQIATACISLEYSALPPTRHGFSIFLENEASTQGLCHMITACQGSHAARNAPPAPPPLSATHVEARWLPSNSICGQRRGHLREHVFHHLAGVPQ